MTSHMKLPLPSRNFPRSTDTTPRSLRSPGGQSPCEAYFNGGMGLSPMSAYFEGPQPQHFFAPQPGPGPVAEPMPSEQPATSLESPTQAPKNTPNAQVNHNKMQMGVQHSMPFVTYPTTQGMPWPVSSQANISIPTTTGPTLLQGAAASVQKAAQAPQVPPKPVQQSRRVDTRSPSNRASCPAAVYVDLSSLRYVVAREHMLQEGLVKELMQRDTEMNKEWRRFFEVEKQWQNIMAHLRSSNTWLALLEVPKISTFCREAAAIMEHIQRSIRDVLDSQRAKVPHLYRLSDAELLRVIRYGHNPAEPAIRACLPGVLSLDVGDSAMSEGVSVRGLVGDIGEYLSLPEELAVQEGMQIQEWLPKLISQMSHLLRWSMFGLLLSNFKAEDPRLLDDKYPLQVRAAALDLAFTTEVESLLVENSSATVLQTRRISLCALIDQIQERRLQAADSEDRGVSFEHFMTGSSSEEEESEEEELTDTENSEEEEVEEEEEEEEEDHTSDESVSSEEDDLPAGLNSGPKRAKTV